MSIIYRQEKGAPLTAQEVDDNFRQLDERVRTLERHYPDRKIHQIKLEGDVIVIYDSAGEVMSSAKVPLLSLNPRGEWQPREAYARNDLITHQDVAYICSHTQKPGTFNPEHWQVLMKFNQENKHEN